MQIQTEEIASGIPNSPSLELTEPHWFEGNLLTLKNILKKNNLPKDPSLCTTYQSPALVTKRTKGNEKC